MFFLLQIYKKTFAIFLIVNVLITNIYSSNLRYFNDSSRHFEMDDPFTENLDVVAVNKYMGWYHPWPVDPSEAVWDVTPDKPLIISEFGGEALYGHMAMLMSRAHGAKSTRPGFTGITWRCSAISPTLPVPHRGYCSISGHRTGSTLSIRKAGTVRALSPTRVTGSRHGISCMSIICSLRRTSPEKGNDLLVTAFIHCQ